MAAGYHKFKHSNVEEEIQRMVKYIEQDGLEKVEEIDIKAEEEFLMEKNKYRDKEIVTIANYYDRLEEKVTRETQAEFCRIKHSSRLKYLQAQGEIIDDIRLQAKERLKNDLDKNDEDDKDDKDDKDDDCCDDDCCDDHEHKRKTTKKTENKYKKVLTDLITQGVYKMMDSTIILRIREKDNSLIKDCIKEVQKNFKETTNIDLNIIVDSEEHLPDDCLGGVIMLSTNGNVSVDNTMEARVYILADKPDCLLLPQFRHMLFGPNPNRKHSV